MLRSAGPVDPVHKEVVAAGIGLTEQTHRWSSISGPGQPPRHFRRECCSSDALLQDLQHHAVSLSPRQAPAIGANTHLLGSKYGSAAPFYVGKRVGLRNEGLAWSSTSWQFGPPEIRL